MAIKCAACGNEMSEKVVGGITVDVCQGDNGCGGLWFDQFEFKKFDEPHETEGAALLDIPFNHVVEVDHAQRRNCPHCDNVVMMRNCFSVRRMVEVDTCPGCAGVHLDCGELLKIRSMFNSEEERVQEAKAYFDDVFGEELAAMAEKSHEDLARARKFSNMFKYICPSYYIPEKQDGGAF